MRTFNMLLVSILAAAMTLPEASARVPGRESLADTPIAVTSVTTKDMDLRVSVMENRLVDLVKLTPGKGFVSGSEPVVMPRGWSCRGKGKSYECAGPATDQAHFSFRGSTPFDVSNEVGVDFYLDGRRLRSEQVRPLDIERIEVIKGPSGVLSLPTGVGPGDLFVVTPTHPIRDGSWGFHAGDEDMAPIDPATLGDNFSGSGLPEDRLLFRVPPSAAEGTEFRFTFDGPFGDRWVDAPAPDYFWGGAGEAPCDAHLADCQEMTVVGDAVCVCGCFPDLTWLGLTLDGRPAPVPSAASSSMIRIPLPEGTQPGTHRITLSETGQSVEFEVVQARGAIDQSLLKVGQSTRLTFGLDGTELMMPMRIGLLEGAVRISGGNSQIAFTSGGADNSFFRVLNAEGVGDFGIDYTFVALPCPCAGDNPPSLVDDSSAIHPASLEGSLGSRFLSGAEGEFPLNFATDSIVARTPYPPLDGEGGFEIEFVQLGLRGSTPKFGEFVFEERADKVSVGRFQDVRLGAEGGFEAGDVDLELYTEFSVPFHKKLPLEVGMTYRLGLTDFEASGAIPELGDLTVRGRPETESTVTFENIRKDAAGKNLYGEATFKVNVHAQLQLRF